MVEAAGTTLTAHKMGRYGRGRAKRNRAKGESDGWELAFDTYAGHALAVALPHPPPSHHGADFSWPQQLPNYKRFKLRLHRDRCKQTLNHMVKRLTPSLDRTFSALSDPTRRQVLDLLSRGSARVTDVALPFPISLPAVSKHLRVLEAAGLVHRERHGREYHFTLNTAPLREVETWIEQSRQFWEQSLSSLRQYLESEGTPK